MQLHQLLVKKRNGNFSKLLQVYVCKMPVCEARSASTWMSTVQIRMLLLLHRTLL